MSVTTRYPERTRPAPITVSQIGIAILSLLTFTGVMAGIWRLIVGLGEGTALSNAYPWGVWIGFDFTLIAFSGSAFTMASVVYLLQRAEYRPVMVPAVLAGLLGYAAVLFFLFLDLGRWDRFHHFILYWNVHSPLFEICWCVLLYTTVLFLENSPLVLERFGLEKPVELIHRYVIPISVAGLTLSSLHQSTLGTLYLNMPHRLHPLWYSPLLSLLFFLSSVMAGLSLAMIAYVAAGRIWREAVNSELLGGLARGVAGVTLLYVSLKLGDIVQAGELSALLAFDRMSWLMGAELGLGAVLPALLFLIPAVRRSRRGQVSGAILVLFGVLMNRFNATLFAQTTPSGETYSPNSIEWLSAMGIVAGAVLAWYLAIRYLIEPEDAAHAVAHH
ncbi:MAG: putative Ni/Fe-hydrogenase 2 b-type cytochrome subunit [Anaerolineales bacterium]|nr:putative Ni/Fe-hydrogenase 2 b-type cytochrome subunit [Anaerolineales bacterium]